ncbi:MAG: SoxR reducing system RseC family protein, partial [Prevotellaceae bacterium]|nr:SoxR reducing system RseC family protein [Prevotellaceae bacterium]
MKTTKKILREAVVEYVEEDGFIVGLKPTPDTWPGRKDHLIFVSSKSEGEGEGEGEPHSHSVGDVITVVETQSLEKKSFSLVYLIPLVALVGSLLLQVSAGVAQGTAGASSLGILALYYPVLYVFRHKLYRATGYSIKN